MTNKEKILRVLKSVLNQKDVNETTSQFNTDQWDSLKHLTLIVELEREFDIEFEPNEIEEMTDFNRIEEYIKGKI